MSRNSYILVNKSNSTIIIKFIFRCFSWLGVLLLTLADESCALGAEVFVLLQILDTERDQTAATAAKLDPKQKNGGKPGSSSSLGLHPGLDRILTSWTDNIDGLVVVKVDKGSLEMGLTHVRLGFFKLLKIFISFQYF